MRLAAKDAADVPEAVAVARLGRPHRTNSRHIRVGLLGIAVAGLAAGAVVWQRRQRRSGTRQPVTAAPPSRTVAAARRLNRAAGVLAFSVLADSGLEHYRGSYRNAAMYIPPLVAAATLAISLFGLADKRAVLHRVRHAVYAVAALTGMAGLAFHAYNVVKRPGHISWHNLFYGAPLGAPAAIGLAGGLGYCAEKVRAASARDVPARLFGLPAGRVVAGLSSVGLLGTVGEVALLHFRGAFQNPAMFVPVAVPPAAALLLARAAAFDSTTENDLARLALRLTVLTGLAGVGFHAYGIARNMGGWRNWSQNILNGPPLPAPPSFTGLALAGLAAVDLIRKDRDEP